ncbi:MAG TPA: bifunctional pyr operon transcriptional regulator/uracil phosphoribosyltransferase PyrR [Phycisphaerae bacterium]|nr:bifunctional pyr operon transcriptional regulator/uracil phosphoribosyltransferase PyrR [Phycisphaerae bacterium]HRY67399.1 bifunctional pyr operon transcriptional regulator/uracil phosphoribosyltransferase PyrR [Phycisphaerae bacterium]HSA29844.1 bifunctional pyr operon transcriptional regulator/uracil phosphoribosyltransferase PyrR [Phycisphaerae bacterium]
MEKTSTHILLTAEGVHELMEQLAQAVFESLPRQAPVGIIGIRRRGEVLAKRLAHKLASRGAQGVAIGSLDITLYRDDLAELGPQAILRQTEIDFDIDGRYIVLVDDVLFTGRSVRAALDALIDLGRPKAIRLAVLVDRPGRELPIQADFVGLKVKQPGVSVTVLLTESDGVEEVRSE